MFRGREADNPSVFCPSLIGPDIVFPSIESEDELSPWMYEEGAHQVYQRLGVFSRGSTVNIDVGNCIHIRSVGKGQPRERRTFYRSGTVQCGGARSGATWGGARFECNAEGGHPYTRGMPSTSEYDDKIHITSNFLTLGVKW